MLLALTLLTGGALLTLVLGVAGGGDPVAVLPLGTAFALLATVGFRWVQRRGSRAWSAAHVVVGLVLAAVVFAAVVTELLRREQAMRRELATAHQQLRDQAAQTERLALAQERNRVARDIHDGLGHSLTVVQMQLQAARALLASGRDAADEQADEVLAKAQHQSQEALAEVRRSVGALREARVVPPLPEALRALAEESAAAGLPTEVAVAGDERPLPDPAREALFRAAQEGLTNVRKHAGAHRAELCLEYADGAVRVAVRDDGHGSAGANPGFGLVGLRERAEQLGGRLELAPAPGGGSALTVEVPA